VKASRDKGLASEWNDDHEIDGDVDFEQHEAQNMVIHTGMSFPAGPVEGQHFYRTDEHKEYFWNGAAWEITPIYSSSNKKNINSEFLAGWTDMSGMTDTFDVNRDCKALIIFSCWVNSEDDVNFPSLAIRIVIDGNVVIESERNWELYMYQALSGANQHRHTWAGDTSASLGTNTLADLTAGNHTIKIQARTYGNGAYVYYGEMDILVI